MSEERQPVKHEGYAWTLVANDAMVTGKPAVLVRMVLHCSTSGGDITVYNGRDTSGRSLGIFHSLSTTSLPIEIGALCEEGIYVDIGSNVTSVLVIWDPLEEP